MEACPQNRAQRALVLPRKAMGAAALSLLALVNAPAHSAPLSPEQTKKIAVDAYIYGYALMTSDITGRAFTNTIAPSAATFQAPVNQLVNMPKYAPANYKGVTAPNADTLYTAAVLDVKKEPMLLSYPDMKDRYFLFPIYSQYTDVIGAPGKRTLGSGAQTIAIVGPGWKGKLPAGVTQVVKSPTNSAFLIGRVYADGTAADFAEVNAEQKEFKLVPLSAYGKAYTPPAGSVDPSAPSVKDKVRDLIAAMDVQTYFNALTKSMVQNPPAKADGPILKEMAEIGIVPGRPFEMSKLSSEQQAALADVVKVATAKIQEQTKAGNQVVNGWLLTTGTGSYGTNYLWRAAVANFAWGANLTQDAIYPSIQNDDTGAPLVGSNTYTVHFAKGEAPPAAGFWSITMYDSSYYFYPNAQNKQTLSLRDKPVFNPDGSLDLYFSNVKPANAPEANWLPAPPDSILGAQLLGFQHHGKSLERAAERIRHLVDIVLHDGRPCVGAHVEGLVEREAHRHRAWNVAFRDLLFVDEERGCSALADAAARILEGHAHHMMAG
jgi:hypothetical protein